MRNDGFRMTDLAVDSTSLTAGDTGDLKHPEVVRDRTEGLPKIHGDIHGSYIQLDVPGPGVGFLDIAMVIYPLRLVITPIIMVSNHLPSGDGYFDAKRIRTVLVIAYHQIKYLKTILYSCDIK